MPKLTILIFVLQFITVTSIFCNENQKTIDKSIKDFESRRVFLLSKFSKRIKSAEQIALGKGDAFGNNAIAYLMSGKHLGPANARLQLLTKWFQLPPKIGPHKNVCDFVAQKLCLAWFFFKDTKVLEVKTKQNIERFFLEENFKSMHASENHGLLFHVSRYLMASEFRDKRFKAWKKDGKKLEEEDLAWLKLFISYRAKHGWGEFDSASYLREVWDCIALLSDYAPDPSLKKMSEMMLDLLLLDMTVDSLNGMYCGAHGRIYARVALDHEAENTWPIQFLYFGNISFDDMKFSWLSVDMLASKYRPKRIVLDIALNRKVSYENRERKHLHNTDDVLPVRSTPGSIKKYTWWTSDYVLGCVQKQDSYPPYAKGRWYAHHQQHEWDLSFSGDTRTRLFSHHRGNRGVMHGYWTGDLGCGCGQIFQNKSALLSIYNINKNQKHQNIHAYVPKKLFDEVVEEKGWIFIRSGKSFAGLKMLNGYKWNLDMKWKKEKHLAGSRSFNMKLKQWPVCEVVSPGAKNAVICEAGSASDFKSFESFREEISKNKIIYNKTKLSLTYYSKKSGKLYLDVKGNRRLNGKQIDLKYKTYDNPYMKSVWGSGLIKVTKGEQSMLLDFRLK